MELRKKHNLPHDENVFVYCSFQSIHKISSESFDTWMRILSSSQKSVLWLTTINNKEAREKLIHRATTKHGITNDRLIFGEQLRVDLHLVRAQACDLYLDSWPYNAHSTATDVLWAGIPLLAYLPDYNHNGRSSSTDQNHKEEPRMWSRVSASLLSTLGMGGELIQSTIQNYEKEAIRYSQNRNSYDSLRKNLLQKRISSPLFDLISYTRHHETAYWEIFVNRFMEQQKPHSSYNVV